MSCRLLRAGLAAAAALALAGPASAWTPRFHDEVAIQSARLMPVSLQRILAEHQGRLKEGARAPLNLGANESLYLHPGGTYGTLDHSILTQSQRVLDLLQTRSSFEVVAYEMGVLSHLVAVAENPAHVAGDDPREAQWSPRFQSFAESKLGRYRVVFDGYLTPALERDDIRGFVQDIAQRSRRHYPLLAKSYVGPDGSVRSNMDFDERHPIYGVASLAYSRSIADTAKLWLYIWIKADGDTTGLPFPQGLSQPRLVKGDRR